MGNVRLEQNEAYDVDRLRSGLDGELDAGLAKGRPPQGGLQIDFRVFTASSKTASTSLTPPTRQASIWHTLMAFACNSCLKTTRFCALSPVAALWARLPGRSQHVRNGMRMYSVMVRNAGRTLTRSV